MVRGRMRKMDEKGITVWSGRVLQLLFVCIWQIFRTPIKFVPQWNYLHLSDGGSLLLWVAARRNFQGLALLERIHPRSYMHTSGPWGFWAGVLWVFLVSSRAHLHWTMYSGSPIQFSSIRCGAYLLQVAEFSHLSTRWAPTGPLPVVYKWSYGSPLNGVFTWVGWEVLSLRPKSLQLSDKYAPIPYHQFQN